MCTKDLLRWFGCSNKTVMKCLLVRLKARQSMYNAPYRSALTQGENFWTSREKSWWPMVCKNSLIVVGRLHQRSKKIPKMCIVTLISCINVFEFSRWLMIGLPFVLWPLSCCSWNWVVIDKMKWTWQKCSSLLFAILRSNFLIQTTFGWNDGLHKKTLKKIAWEH